MYKCARGKDNFLCSMTSSVIYFLKTNPHCDVCRLLSVYLSVFCFGLFLVNLVVLDQLYITFFSVSHNTLPRLQKQTKKTETL